jgi:hypothetical protein
LFSSLHFPGSRSRFLSYNKEVYQLFVNLRRSTRGKVPPIIGCSGAHPPVETKLAFVSTGGWAH